MAYESRKKKISTFAVDDALTDASTLDFIKNGINKKTSWANIRNKLAEVFGLSARIFATEADLIASDIAIGEHAIVEENNTALYKITSLAANSYDVTLTSGFTASLEGPLLLEPVADYTALRAINTKGIKTGQTLSVTNSGIAGSGVLRNVVAHGLTDNGGTIIVISADWYWERSYSGYVMLSWFGATEAAATNYTEIEAAKSYCVANKKWLYINDDMTFFTDQTIAVVSGMWVRGSGTVKLAASSDVRVFENPETPVVELEDVRLRDFTVDGNRANQTSNNSNNDGVRINYVDGLYIDKIKVTGCGTPDTSANNFNNAVGLSLHECINFHVKFCVLSDCQHYNFQAWECVDGLVIGNISNDPGSHCFGGSANLRVKYQGNAGSIIWSRSNFIYDATINAGQGFWFRQYEDCIISSNTVYRKTDGVSPTPAGAACQNGNEASLTPTPQSPRLNGILVPNQSVKGTQWSNNNISGDFEFGIYGYSGSIEKTITNGNVIDGCWAAGLIVTSGRLISSGDTVKNSGGSVGAAITGITQANPAVVTSVAHPYSNGDSVYIANVVGMIEVNGAFYTVANAAANTFELSGINSTGFGAYVSGGIIMTICAAIWAQGRDHKITGPMIYNAESNGLYVQGVRSSISGPKIEGYGQSIPGSAIYIRNFSNDCNISGSEIYTDTPASQSYSEIWIGDDAARTNVSGGTLSGHPTPATAIHANNRSDHNVSNVIGFAAAGGQKYKTPQRQGVDYFWVDSTGDFRVKTGSAPSTDTDGVIIGTQT